MNRKGGTWGGGWDVGRWMGHGEVEGTWGGGWGHSKSENGMV